MPTQEKQGNRPVKSFRLRGVSVSVFANPAEVEGHATVFHKINVQRTYKEGQEFKTTSSLNRDDLPIAALLLQKAWEWVLETEAEHRNEASP
jgi:hypothetical protein